MLQLRHMRNKLELNVTSEKIVKKSFTSKDLSQRLRISFPRF